ncbi:MAG: DUF1553 domain-containing protein [Verrucomicrobiaceae bacterium]|nr:MAG: DUF1553 domain-containing protein [Verrucomicrobiaceae bacterium]
MQLPSQLIFLFFLIALNFKCLGKAQEEFIYFEKEIRPILKEACFHCHGEDNVKKGDLDLRLVRLMIEGGKSGSALHPKKPDQSLLWKNISNDRMPKGENKLSTKQKEKILKWIEQGSKTVRPEPVDVEEARYTQEELSHWAFQPIKRTNPPTEENNPIDSFIIAKLQSHGLDISEPAQKETLIRRLSYDLTGLPPTPEQIEIFIQGGDGAYDRLVEELLSSPQYGVRWARHWLDVAGFAETEGAGLQDAKRPHAWRYRDYVINSFNANKPIDQFIVEQLAGDELINGSIDKNNSKHLEFLSATSFLRMGPDTTQRNNTLAERNNAIAETLKIVSQSLLGLTIGCAQCHDHKYDPISIDDYYSFRAIFDPAFPLKQWQTPNSRLIDVTNQEVMEERAKIESEAKVLEDDLISRRNAHCQKIQELKLETVPEEERDATRQAVLTKPENRNEKQKALLLKHPMVKPVNFIVGLLVEYDGKAFAKFKEEQKKIDAVRNKKPPLSQIRATIESKNLQPVSRIFFRGNPESPKEVVKPSEIIALKQHRKELIVPENDDQLLTTGRRLNYAKQLTDGSHPMTARVFVNRIWMHHFGNGIVRNRGDFGIAGEKPIHQDLLDWLANDFVIHGWDLKRLHKIIVSSKTYKQSSTRRSEIEKIDPDNHLFGRSNMKRLEAESIRDSLLMISGKLDSSIGGPSIPVTKNNEGKSVLSNENGRRSIFVQVQRRLPLNILATFDQPVMTPNCNKRKHTTVATQALWFMNDNESLKISEALAKSIMTESPDLTQQLNLLFIKLFAKKPTPEEIHSCIDYLHAQSERLAKQNAAKNSDHLAMASLCQALFASNRFLFVD